MKTALALLLAALLLVALLDRSGADYRRTISYEKEVVVRCASDGSERLRPLMEHNNTDVWGAGPDGVDIRMHETLYQQIQLHFPECALKVENLEDFVRAWEKKNMQHRVDATWFEEYHEYPDIVNWYTELSMDFPGIVKFVPSIGKSVQGRDMPAVHITASTSTETRKIYFQCQIHAREWISGATCMYIAGYLAENYGKNAEVTDVLRNVEFILVPFMNPDGYAYTWSTDRMWRKNRRKGLQCDGVDLNRNYNSMWGGGGSSGSECSETYRGDKVESEPETQNTVAYFKKNGPILGAVDWHSFSQLILRPWGYTRTDAPDEMHMKALGDEMSVKIKAVHGKTYTSQKAIDLYMTTGTARDWFYTEDAAEQNKGYRAAGYTIELRDTGQYGFLLPPDQIIPTGEEIVPAAVYFAQALLANPIPNLKNDTIL